MSEYPSTLVLSSNSTICASLSISFQKTVQKEYKSNLILSKLQGLNVLLCDRQSGQNLWRTWPLSYRHQWWPNLVLVHQNIQKPFHIFSPMQHRIQEGSIHMDCNGLFNNTEFMKILSSFYFSPLSRRPTYYRRWELVLDQGFLGRKSN